MTEDRLIGGVLYTDFTRLMQKEVGGVSRMISGSKSGYRSRNPDNLVYFNACIFNKKFQLIWCGDLDITLDLPKLQSIAQRCGGEYYVTPEFLGHGIGRNDKFGKKDLKDKSVVVIGKKN